MRATEEEAGFPEPLESGRGLGRPAWGSRAWLDSPVFPEAGQAPGRPAGSLEGKARPWVFWEQGRSAAISRPELGFLEWFYQG